MEDDRTSLRSTDARQWERPWSTAEIRENSANWTLAGDTGLLHLLQEYAHNLISRTHETEKLVNELVYKNKAIGAKVNNVINDFQMLSNEQFIENRVYDEEVEDTKASAGVPEVQKTKEQREAEMIPRVTQALELGLSVLDQAFHKVQVEETSDSEEDEYRVVEGRIVLEPKDPYEYRPLPFIIGSKEFEDDDFVGLRDLYVEDFVEKLVDEESVSLASLSSSSLNESDVEIESPYQKDTLVPQDYMEEIVPSRNIERAKSTASESSDLFDMEKGENDFTSNLEAEDRMLKENEQNKKLTDDLLKEVKSVTRNKIEPEVTKEISQVTKQQIYDDDLFGSVESDNIADDNSPFQKKPGGLFSTDLAFTNGKDDASDDDDLFGTKEKNDVISSKPEPTYPKVMKVAASSKETKAPDLFGESDGENEDIFTALSSSKKSFSIPQPSSATKKNDQKEVAKTSEIITSVPDVAKKKSSNTFTDFDDKSSSDSLFGDDSTMNNLFITKSEKMSGVSHFMADEDHSDLFSSLKISDISETKKEDKLFKEKQPSQQSKGPSLLFGDADDDDDEFDFFGSSKTPNTFASSKEDPPKMFDVQKEISSKSTVTTKKVSSPRTDLVKEAPKTTDYTETTNNTYAKNSVPAQETFNYKNIVSSKASTPVAPALAKEVANEKLPVAENHVDISVSFDEPMDPHSMLNVVNKGRAKIPGKRRKPTRKARRPSLTSEKEDSEIEEPTKKTTETDSSTKSDLSFLEESSEVFDRSSNDVTSSDLQITPKKIAPFGIHKSIMSKLVSEISNSKVGRKDSASKDSFEDDDDFFSPASDDLGNSKISDFLQTSSSQQIHVETSQTSVVKAGKTENKILDKDSTLDDDDLFSEPAFRGFRTSIHENDSIFNLDDEEDIFKTVEANKQKSAITSTESSDDIFAYSEEDIFAGVGKEKYEMISGDLYEDDDDIFGNLDASVKQATTGSNIKKTSKVEAPKKESVDIFEDPLTGFSSE